MRPRTESRPWSRQGDYPGREGGDRRNARRGRRRRYCPVRILATQPLPGAGLGRARRRRAVDRLLAAGARGAAPGGRGARRRGRRASAPPSSSCSPASASSRTTASATTRSTSRPAARAGSRSRTRPACSTRRPPTSPSGSCSPPRRRIVAGDRFVREGRWRAGWARPELLGRDLAGATLGIVGLGRIGSAVARRACAFDMRVLHTGAHGRAARTTGIASWTTCCASPTSSRCTCR